MKKEVIDYRVDSFIDYEGIERKFIVAAISSPHKTFKRMISLGVSVCHKDDVFDENLGLRVAVNNAKKANLKIFATVAGMVSTKTVRALIDQETEYFKNNPSSHIHGYSQMENKYLAELARKERLEIIKNNLDDNQKKLLDEVNKLPKDVLNNFQKLINVQNMA